MEARLGLVLCGISLTAVVHGLYQLRLRHLYSGILFLIDLPNAFSTFILFTELIDLLAKFCQFSFSCT